MSADVQRDDVERFREEVAQHLGLHFDDGKLGLLASVLERRMRARGLDAGGYLQALASQPRFDEVRALVPDLTVAETFFFRNMAQFDAFAEVVLPERMNARPAGSELQVLSAGCASGEEPYSLAIVLLERGARLSRGIAIRAVDINPVNLAKAERGRYSPWSLRETPPEIRRRWFREDDQELELDPEVRKRVRFQEVNLVEANPELWKQGSYDVVFCRNLLMYFTPASAQLLVTRVTQSLAPGGFLFLGHAETLRNMSNDFHLHHSHGTFYYQRKDAGEKASREAFTSPWRRALSDAVVDEHWATTWIGTVNRASDRIRALSASAAALPEPSPAPPLPDRVERVQLGRALELLKGERFEEALAELGTRASTDTSDPDMLVLRAALLMHAGKLSEAEQACSELLQLDELNASAHYLLGLCHAEANRTDAAIHHHEVAAYLDPGFAMPRLQLGLLARRAGDSARASRELKQALVLLQREEVSRLLLFGGGFGREAWIALCRTQLQGMGEQP